MSDDEDDYMSDKLLQKIEDIRPGVPMKRTQQRTLEVSKRKADFNKKHKTKKIHVLEAEKRDEGLATPIDASNKGFSLLTKMGFKPGMTLGAEQTSSSSAFFTPLAEPIEVKLKTDGRGGLGLAAKKDEESRERVEKHLAQAAAASRNCALMAGDFRRERQNLFKERLLRADLHRSRRVCRQLDVELGREAPSKIYFWPSDPTEETANVQDEQETEELPMDTVMLEEITKYLRGTYFYCIWCGCKYPDADNLDSSCPGDTKELHDDCGEG